MNIQTGKGGGSAGRPVGPSNAWDLLPEPDLTKTVLPHLFVFPGAWFGFNIGVLRTLDQDRVVYRGCWTPLEWRGFGQQRYWNLTQQRFAKWQDAGRAAEDTVVVRIKPLRFVEEHICPRADVDRLFHPADISTEHYIQIGVNPNVEFVGGFATVAPKPPIGFMPRRHWNRKRFREVLAAIRRYREARMVVPLEWYEELTDLAHYLESPCGESENT